MNDQPGTTPCNYAGRQSMWMESQCQAPYHIDDGVAYCDVCGKWRPSKAPKAALPLDHDDIVERVAVAIEETMFAPHEFPLDRELHEKYRHTASEAIAVVRQWDAGK